MNAGPDRTSAVHAFVVAVEYRGDDLPATPEGQPRVAVCEHAYDLQTAQLAATHHDGRPRVAFPAHLRGWNTAPQTVRCPVCDAAVEHIVRDLIAGIVSTTAKRLHRT